MGAIGAILAIFATWGLSRAEYRRVTRSEREKRNREIDVLRKIVDEFQAIMLGYYAFSAAEDPDAVNFHSRHMNDPEFHSMSDLAHISVIQWPSIDSYAKFKDYWFGCIKDLNDANVGDKASARFAACKARYDEFVKALEVVKRSR